MSNTNEKFKYFVIMKVVEANSNQSPIGFNVCSANRRIEKRAVMKTELS